MIALQHFHDRDRCFLFDLPVMVIVSQFIQYLKENIWHITGTEDIPCPVCGGQLFVHGTCLRNVRKDSEQQLLRLRVLECEHCGRTHRELPSGIVPYKRHSAEAICQVAEYPDQCLEEPSVCRRIQAWLTWFLCYAQNIAASLAVKGFSVSEPSGDSRCRQLEYFVRLVVNAGYWEQHRSAMTWS